jgi:hypothetical protein
MTGMTPAARRSMGALWSALSRAMSFRSIEQDEGLPGALQHSRLMIEAGTLAEKRVFGDWRIPR